MGEFRMPSLGAEMDAGRLLTWYVEPGQQVRRGDVVAEVETDKADIDVEVFEDGTIGELLVEEGAHVPVGTPLATILASDGAVAPATADTPTPTPAPAPPPPASAPTAIPPPAPAATPPPATEPVPAEHPGDAPAASPVPATAGVPPLNPVLRRLAEHLEVDVARLRGTGPGGRVTRADVEGAAPHRPVHRPSAPAQHVPRSPSGVRASPYARRLAAERDVALATLSGSGPHGALVAADVPTVVTLDTPASDRGSPPPPVDDRDAAMRRAIARAMARSKREIPHYYLGHTVDVEPMLTWLEAHNDQHAASERLLPAALLLKAVARAAVDFPELNGTWEDDRFHPADGVQLGVAISRRGGGLIAPVIRDADTRPLPELMGALQDLVRRTRRGGLRGSELSGGSLTVSNLGDTGVETVLAVIQPPQVALVGAGAIRERPWAEDGQVVARRCLHLTLAADHRASDGHLGGRFLAAIAEHLRRPEQL